MKVNEIINKLETEFKWMKITKNTNEKYMIEDMRFTPYSVYKFNLTESELMEELKPYLLEVE